MEEKIEAINFTKHWIKCKLKDIGKIVSGGTPSTEIKEYWANEINWITPADLSGYSNITISKGRKSISKIGLEKSSAKLLPKGTILYSSRAPIGYVAIAATDLTTNQGFKNIIPNLGINSKYVFYYLKSIKHIIFENASGTTFKEISGSKFSEIPIIIPQLLEQEKIVSKIEELFSELDKGVESLKKAQQQLKVFRQAVLKWAFEGKMTNKVVKEGELPEGWERFAIGILVKTIDGDRGPNYPKKNEFFEKEFCLFLSTKNVREDRFEFKDKIFISEEKDKKLRSGKLQLNDVVVTTRGTLGNVALYDSKVPYKNIRINSGMLILRIVNPLLLNYYLMKFITSPIFIQQLKKMQTGTAQPQIPANVLREIIIPIGHLKEQELIVQEIESRLSVCDKIEETITASLLQSEALRQSILKKAFEGKLLTQEDISEFKKDISNLSEVQKLPSFQQ